MLDKPMLQTLRHQIDAALGPIAEANGVIISLGNGSFTPNAATFKLNIGAIDENGQAHTKESEDYRRFAHRLGLNPDWLEQEFTNGNGERCKVVGLKPRATKYPVLYVRLSDGQRFKAAVGSIKFAFAREEAAA